MNISCLSILSFPRVPWLHSPILQRSLSRVSESTLYYTTFPVPSFFFVECKLTQKRFPFPRAQPTAPLSKRDKDCLLQVKTLWQGRRATDNTHGAQSGVTVPKPHAASPADAHRPGWKGLRRAGSGPLRSRPPTPNRAPAEWGVDALKQSPIHFRLVYRTRCRGLWDTFS